MLSPSPCAPVPRAPQGHLGRHGQGGQRPRRFAAVGFLSALPRAAKASRLRAAAVPLELQADFEDVDELRVEAAHTVGAFSVTSTQWPPKKLVTNTSLLDPVKAETTIGRYTGSAPPFEEWPFFEAPSNFCEEFGLEDSDELLKAYKVVNFDEVGLTRALVLAIRWQKANLGRSAGFDRMGMGVLSAFKHTNPIFMRQLQGLNVLRRHVNAEQLSEQQLEDFLRDVGCEANIAAEFKAVAPVGRAVHVTGLISAEGSGLAMWSSEGGDGRVELLLGHDCLVEGPKVEELLLRLVARSCKRMRCRARFTEKGKLVAPFKALGFKLAPGEKEFSEDASDEEARSNVDFTKPKDYKYVPEAVEGLKTWLLLLCLEDRIEPANEWCREMGAAHLDEVIESREDLAEFLWERGVITPGERQAVRERDR